MNYRGVNMNFIIFIILGTLMTTLDLSNNHRTKYRRNQLDYAYCSYYSGFVYS